MDKQPSNQAMNVARKRKKSLRKPRGLKGETNRTWGEVIKEATLEQIQRRETDCNLLYGDSAKHQPRRIYHSEEEVHYMDHEANPEMNSTTSD